MKHISWETITVRQYQAVMRLVKADMDALDRLDEIICVLHDMTLTEVGELSGTEYGKYAKSVQFLVDNENIPGAVRNKVHAGNHLYNITPLPTSLNHRQFIEVQKFSQNIIENLHYLLASICSPIKWGFLPSKNDWRKHSEYAEDFLDCKLIDVYHAAVFFCKVYTASLRSTADYLMRTMEDKGKAAEVWMRLNDTANTMDGLITRKE